MCPCGLSKGPQSQLKIPKRDPLTIPGNPEEDPLFSKKEVQQENTGPPQLWELSLARLTGHQYCIAVTATLNRPEPTSRPPRLILQPKNHIARVVPQVGPFPERGASRPGSSLFAGAAISLVVIDRTICRCCVNRAGLCTFRDLCRGYFRGHYVVTPCRC